MLLLLILFQKSSLILRIYFTGAHHIRLFARMYIKRSYKFACMYIYMRCLLVCVCGVFNVTVFRDCNCKRTCGSLIHYRRIMNGCVGRRALLCVLWSKRCCFCCCCCIHVIRKDVHISLLIVSLSLACFLFELLPTL